MPAASSRWQRRRALEAGRWGSRRPFPGLVWPSPCSGEKGEALALGLMAQCLGLEASLFFFPSVLFN